jgi:hypothetical protein
MIQNRRMATAFFGIPQSFTWVNGIFMGVNCITLEISWE